MLLLILVTFSLSGVTLAAEDVVERVTHGDHEDGADEDGDDCMQECQEHFCVGPSHSCGCCPSLVALGAGSTTLPLQSLYRMGRRQLDDTVVLDGIRSRIDRPPRA